MNPLYDEQQSMIARIRISDGRSHRGFYFTMLALILAAAVITAALCFYFQSTAGGETPAVSSESQPSSITDPSSEIEDTSSETNSTESVSSDPVSEPSSAPTSDPMSSAPTSDQPSSSSAGNVPSAAGTSAAQAFEKNTLDPRHMAAINAAETTEAMLEAYDDALDAWKKQISAMVTRLGAYTIENQQTLQHNWEKNTEAAIQQKEDELSRMGGTLQRLELAQYTYTCYRERAKELFVQIYPYDPTYIF